MTKISLLGRDGYGHVYLFEKNTKKYAVKVSSNKDHAYNILKKEKEMLKYLSGCKGIPKFIAWKYPDFIDDKSKKALYMEYISGKSLHDLPSNAVNVYGLLYDILKILVHIHDQDIIHGDIKSGNILVFDNNTIKLTLMSDEIDEFDITSDTRRLHIEVK